MLETVSFRFVEVAEPLHRDSGTDTKFIARPITSTTRIRHKDSEGCFPVIRRSAHLFLACENTKRLKFGVLTGQNTRFYCASCEVQMVFEANLEPQTLGVLCIGSM